MRRKTLFQVVLLAAATGVAHGSIILSENFDSSVPSGAYSGNISNSVFMTGGANNVDIVGDQNGSFFLCNPGPGTNCLDLVGNTGVPSSIQSIATFSVVGGQAYELDFDASPTGSSNGFTFDGSAAFGADSFNFSVTGGNGINPISHLVWNFTPAANQSNVRLVFNETTAPNVLNGISLDNIVLSTTPVSTAPAPEPASFVMLGAGLAVVYAARRRR